MQSDDAVTVVRFDSEEATTKTWSLVETAYAEACAIAAGCEPGQAQLTRPTEDLSGFLALLGG